MLQIRHENEANDDHQEPRSYFLAPHHSPSMRLVGILPSTEISRNVFSHPDKKCDEQKRKIERHRASFFCDSKINFCLPEENKNCSYQENSKVVDKMIGEKINADSYGSYIHLMLIVN